MRAIRIACIGCASAVAASLLLARVHPFGDAGLDAGRTAPAATRMAIMEHSSVPAEVRATREHPSLAAGSRVQAAGGGDPIRGKQIFEKRCTGCHAMTANREGPRLQGVYGRASGEVAAFGYSSALKQAHIVWNDTSLEQWLSDPDTLVPGNNMEFRVANPQERRDLIAFLGVAK